MGLFGKKYCDICGDKIKLLGSRKAYDGNICKKCDKKLSPWFDDRRGTTVSDIKDQIEYREENKKRVEEFVITKDIQGNREHVYIDDRHGWFSVGYKMNIDENPDVLDMIQITNCYLDTREIKDEESYLDDENNIRTYNPPRYTYSYDYYIKISVESKWFDSITFKLNTFAVESQNRNRMRQMEDIGSLIIESLTRGSEKRNTFKEEVIKKEINCRFCGFTPEEKDNPPKFCPNCGQKL